MVSLKKRTIFCLHLRVVSPVLPARLQHSSAVLHSTALTSRGTRGICCLHAHKCQSQSRVQRSIIKCKHHQVQHACCLMALLCPWVCVASKTPMPTATHSWARDGQRRQTSVQQVCNKCATSVQQVWYLLRGVIELARAPGHAPKHMQRNLRASTRTAFRRVSADAREQGRCRQPSNSLPTNPKGTWLA
jgi:hypothetical protein